MITATLGHDVCMQNEVRIAETAMNQSLLILGTSGSGKSWAEQKIIRKLAENGAAIVVPNFHGTHDGMAGDYVRKIDVQTEGFPLPLFGLTSSDGENQEGRMQLMQRALKIFLSVESLAVRQTRVLRMALTNTIMTYEAGENDFAKIRNNIKRIASQNETLEDAANALLDRFFEAFFYISTQCKPVLVPGKISVIDFSGYEEMTQRMLTEFVLAILWRDVRFSNRKKSDPMYVVLDEFQALKCRPGGVLEEILREGRKYQFNLILVTQTLATFPQEMRSILQLPATKLYFPLVEKDRKALLQDLPWEPEKGESVLHSLQKGVCLAVGCFSIGKVCVDYPQIISFWEDKEV